MTKKESSCTGAASEANLRPHLDFMIAQEKRVDGEILRVGQSLLLFNKVGV